MILKKDDFLNRIIQYTNRIGDRGATQKGELSGTRGHVLFLGYGEMPAGRGGHFWHKKKPKKSFKKDTKKSPKKGTRKTQKKAQKKGQKWHKKKPKKRDIFDTDSLPSKKGKFWCGVRFWQGFLYQLGGRVAAAKKTKIIVHVIKTWVAPIIYRDTAAICFAAIFFEVGRNFVCLAERSSFERRTLKSGVFQSRHDTAKKSRAAWSK